MFKKSLPILILLLVVVILISGCIDTNSTYRTFGEKTISLNSLVLYNVTADHELYEGVNYYYIQGDVLNKGVIDAFNVKMKATVYDKNGSVVATNNSVYLHPKSISGNGKSYFYFEFIDQDQKIVNYTVKIVNASAEP